MFIQMVQGHCSRPEEMHRVVDDWCTAMADQPGWLGGTYGFTDDEHFVGVVRFDSREACQDAAGTPAAAMCWAAAESLCDRGLEIDEADDVSIMLEGGSDEAGFVQVIHGRISDADRFQHATTDTAMTSMLHQARPEIIGATLGIEADGRFIETVAFTDEAAARRGEQTEMPAELQDEFQSSVSDLEYLDLHRPWFASHR